MAEPQQRGGDRGRHGYLLVVGPDGAGKSTVVDAIQSRAEALGIPLTRGHHRPGLIAGRPEAPQITDPHARPPRSAVTGAVKLAVVFLDHVLGAAVRWRPRGVVVVERGWLDMAVDPRRYRLTERLSPAVRLLGRFVRRPDVVLLLTGDAERLHARKPEIGTVEVARQIARWRELAPTAGGRVLEVDTVEMEPAATASAALAALPTNGTPSMAWRRVPFTARRLSLRCQGDAAAARSVYHPFSPAARAGAAVGWRTARLAGRAGRPPLADLDDLWRLLGLEPDGVVAMRSSSSERVLLAPACAGRLAAVLKVGVAADSALRREAALLQAPLSGELPFHRPAVRWSGEWRDRFVLVTEPVQRASTELWTADEVVPLASALGAAGPDGASLVHGDLAPWNMVRTKDGPVLLDWESSRWADEPLYDFAHFVVQDGALLGRYSPGTAVSLLCDEGGPGARVLRAWGRSPAEAQGLLAEYLRTAQPTKPRARRFLAEMVAMVAQS